MSRFRGQQRHSAALYKIRELPGHVDMTVEEDVDQVTTCTIHRLFPNQCFIKNNATAMHFTGYEVVPTAH